MKKIIPLLLLGAVNAFAISYDFREKTQLHCESKNSKIQFSATIQLETFNGWNGFPVANNAKANVKVSGKIDGYKVKINKTIEFAVDSKERLANMVELSVGTQANGITQSLLENLTADASMPGKSSKISIPDGSDIMVANIVHAQESGFASLNLNEEHLETLSVVCSEKRDTADSGQDYFEEFQKI